MLTEVLHCAAKSARPLENRREVERFAGRLDVLAFDADAATHAADIRAKLKRRGRAFGGYNLLIAGQARNCRTSSNDPRSIGTGRRKG